MRARLHERVRAFIAQSAAGETTAETFDALALAVANYQAEHIPAYARLLRATGVHPREVTTLRDLPAVPTDAFRLARIAAHAPADDVVVFRTSGTTDAARGAHALSTTATYELAALAWGEWALFFDRPADMTAIVLGPSAGGVTDSSLHFMMSLFGERFARRVRFVQDAIDVPIDAAVLRTACEEASAAGGPAIVMGSSFAFVHAIDALGGACIPTPSGSRAMYTGGFKGRSREVAPDELRRRIATTFGLDESALVGEYGMTELGSQLYEGTLRVHAGLPAASALPAVFLAPPWLRVVAAHPETLAPLPDGEVGILRFEDLANVDGAVAIQTADRGRCDAQGVELLGRAPGAPPRGCSLAMEELLGRTS